MLTGFAIWRESARLLRREMNRRESLRVKVSGENIGDRIARIETHPGSTAEVSSGAVRFQEELESLTAPFDEKVHQAARRLDGVNTEHRVVVGRIGKDAVTLADLFLPSLRAVRVAIDPAWPSVAAGHYFQKQLGQQFVAWFRPVGVVGATANGSEDAAPAQAAIGFTDLVKRHPFRIVLTA